jgi:hypothetical protein|tara:strand:- start:4142 stop:4369 length:228 start_codon:yes stop_codon:yes gene_type:complete
MLIEPELTSVLNGLKYLNRLNVGEFRELLFPNSEIHYLEGKWLLFRTNPLHFLWSCSTDKLELIIDYINQFSSLD